jgi:hypothetical protein
MPHPKRERGIGKNERKKNERKREGPFVMKAWAPPFDVVFFFLATSGYLGPI